MGPEVEGIIMSQESIAPLHMIVVGSGRGKSHARSFLARPDKFKLVGLVDIDEPRLKAAIHDLELPDRILPTLHTRRR